MPESPDGEVNTQAVAPVESQLYMKDSPLTVIGPSEPLAFMSAVTSAGGITAITLMVTESQKTINFYLNKAQKKGGG